MRDELFPFCNFFLFLSSYSGLLNAWLEQNTCFLHVESIL
jgi:hypothetical protein